MITACLQSLLLQSRFSYPSATFIPKDGVNCCSKVWFVLLRESLINSAKHLASVSGFVYSWFICNFLNDPLKPRLFPYKDIFVTYFLNISMINPHGNVLHTVCNVFTYRCQLRLLRAGRMMVVNNLEICCFSKGLVMLFDTSKSPISFMSQNRLQSKP